jgi:hypothetical protein
MSEWIRVKDRLPEEYCQYLVCLNGVIELVYFNPYHKCWDDYDGDDYYRNINYFTHWMPLPEPPEAGK